MKWKQLAEYQLFQFQNIFIINTNPLLLNQQDKEIPYELRIERMVLPQQLSNPLLHQKFGAANHLIHLKNGEGKMLAKTSLKRKQPAEELKVKREKAQQQAGQGK